MKKPRCSSRFSANCLAIIGSIAQKQMTINIIVDFMILFFMFNVFISMKINTERYFLHLLCDWPMEASCKRSYFQRLTLSNLLSVSLPTIIKASSSSGDFWVFNMKFSPSKAIPKMLCPGIL